MSRTAPTKEQRQSLPPFSGIAPEQIHIPATAAEFAHAAQALHNAPILGFDTESKPLFQAKQTDYGPHLVQFATAEAAWLLQLHHPQAAVLCRNILESSRIIKVGFGLQHDRQQLRLRLAARLNNILDLDRYFSKQGYGPNLGVCAAVAVVLQQYFHKSKHTTTSNWASQALSSTQIMYAANDAYAAARVYMALPQPPTAG